MRRAVLMICGLSLTGLTGPGVAGSAQPVPIAVPDEPHPFFSDTSFDTDEIGLHRQKHREDLEDRSTYTDGGSMVTASEIKAFLERHDSPMAQHADEIVLAGNRHGIDPRMVVAIAGVESQYGKRCRGFNAWGWNGGRQRWSSWSESIDEYSASMGTRYPNWRNIRRVAPRYNPNTPEAWGRKVTFLMASIQATA